MIYTFVIFRYAFLNSKRFNFVAEGKVVKFRENWCEENVKNISSVS